MKEMKLQVDKHDPYIKVIRDALLAHDLPFATGTVAVKREDLILRYGETDGVSCQIDLCSATDKELEHLRGICDPANHGHGGDDADQTSSSHHDTHSFSIGFHPTSSGIIGRFRDRFLEEQDKESDIRVELRHLSIYGLSSVHKVHKDVRRSEGVLASLVIVMPTPHSGGALRFRHGEINHTFDTSEALRQAQAPSVAYVAFFGDVKHELGVVTSGYRVALTYNLALANMPTGRLQTDALNARAAETLSQALNNAYKDEGYLRRGGVLGFGLRNRYQAEDFIRGRLEITSLKGSDAVLWAVCQWTGLDCRIGVVYHDNVVYKAIIKDGNGVSQTHPVTKDVYVLCDHLVSLQQTKHDSNELWEYLLIYKKGKLLTGINGHKPDVKIRWVTEMQGVALQREGYPANGGQERFGYVNWNLVLTIHLPPATGKGRVGPVQQQEHSSEGERDGEEESGEESNGAKDRCATEEECKGSWPLDTSTLFS